MTGEIVIDCFPERVAQYRRSHALVLVDVVRATTTAITAVNEGWRCFPARSIEHARQLAFGLGDALLAGEQGGEMPPGFDINNSPTELLTRKLRRRALVLLSSSGTRLCSEADGCPAAFLACLRNHVAAADAVRGFPRIAIIGAGSRGEFREEDQMCCAWIAARLLESGYSPADGKTMEIALRWKGSAPDAWITNKSAAYLVRSGQGADLAFILQHINDLDTAFILRGGEVVAASPPLDLAAKHGASIR